MKYSANIKNVGGGLHEQGSIAMIFAQLLSPQITEASAFIGSGEGQIKQNTYVCE